ncbi:MAG: DNA cytosine methyltransferase [Oscillospiraceae bacterium]|nr:DNA cytosine methyltransferase [Oscillospiraceae bacterium]
MKVIDLFAGCGGLSLGFINEGYQIVKAVEFDKSIAQTYKTNHPNIEVIVDDIKNVDHGEVFKENDADVIIGGPPCQGFSMAGARIRDGFMGDPRNFLFKHYFNVVKAVKPKVFVMENVKGITTMENGKIFNEILSIFSDPSLLDGSYYNLYPQIVRAIDFGVPQKRERMIIIGVRNKEIDVKTLWDATKEQIKKIYPDYFDRRTVRDAIGNLPSPSITGVVSNPVAITSYQSYLSCAAPELQNHIKTNHSKVAIDRMAKISNGENFTSLDENIKSVHSGSYGRLCWNEQAPTITTRFDTPAGGRFIHPSEDRTLTPREAARIQSFPDDFVFTGNKTSVCKQIGNAVPPKISYFLAKLVRNIIEMEDSINE